MTEPKASRDRRLRRNGGVLVLASTVFIAMIATWEDGPKSVLVNTSYTVYADKIAGNLPTTCYGLTRHATVEPVIVGDVWDKARCERVFAAASQNLQYGVLDCVPTANLTQNMFDALGVFAHNVGIGAACASRAFALIERGRFAEGCRAMYQRPDGTPNWSYVKGVFKQGLLNRRISEAALCLKGLPEPGV